MGYPKCTTELIESAVRLKKNGMSNKDMAACLGISESTLYKWLRNPKSRNQVELCQSLKNAEGEFFAALRSKIMAKTDEDWKAAAWMLERMRPEEYGRPEARLQREEPADDRPVIVLGVEARPLG